VPETFLFVPDSYGQTFLLSIVRLFKFRRGDVADRFEEPPSVEPGYPFEGSVLHSLETLPRTALSDDLGLEGPVDGFGYDSIFGAYLQGAKIIEVEDPYIRSQHQVQNFIRFCELIVKTGDTEKITLLTGFDDPAQKKEIQERFDSLKDSLANVNIGFDYQFKETIHDREIRLSTGWRIKLGRGLDIYQRPESWFIIGANDLALRPCLETMVDIFKAE
jgi:hypothetical protein